MIYDIILYFILFIATILIIVSCSIGTKRNKSNRELEDKMDKLNK
tara:strand:+ start:331 stop:465 length:135 start_codon:yes stop_codon:yes gene_type:complete